MGLHRAGFDVTGIDIRRQPRYPFRFIQGDALKPPVRLEHFDLVWASPPCQAFSSMKFLKNAKRHPNLIPDTRALLQSAGRRYVIENVPGAPLESAFMLCGSSFNLRSHGRRYLRRHRYFEANFFVLSTSCVHDGIAVGVYGHGSAGHLGQKIRSAQADEARLLMDMPWATREGCSQAVPPAYAEHIGRYAMMALNNKEDQCQSTT